MATRMQQRRGTASQWTTANPILAAGEIGFETDTGEFRVGDGLNAWADLSPFKNIVDLGGNLDDYVLLSTKGQPLGVASLNEDGLIPLNQLTLISDNVTSAINGLETSLTNDIATAKAAAETSAQGYVDTHATDTTNVHGISDTSVLATKEGVETLKNKTISYLTNNIAIVAANIGDVTASAAELNILDGATLSTTELNYVDGVTSAIQTQLDAKANLAAPSFTGNTKVANLEVTGDLTIGGTTTTVNASNLVVSDPLIYMGGGNTSDVVDLGFVSSYNDGSYHHTGLARDASDSKWKLFSSVEDEPTTTINFSQAVYDTLVVGGIEYSDGVQVKQGVPSLTEINQQTASYTSVLSDRDKLIEINSSSGVTLTIPTNASVAYPVGTSFDILQTGSGQVTIAGAGGVTVNATPGLKLRAQWSSATLFKRATDTWVVYGDLSA